MNAARTALAPLPKHFQGFETQEEAQKHCVRFGAAPLTEQRADGLHWPCGYATRELALEAAMVAKIDNAYAMGLRQGVVTRYAVGVMRDVKPVGDRDASIKAMVRDTVAKTSPSPVATGDGKRMAGATTICKQLAAERPETLASKDTFIAACAELGVIAATAGTQWYRLRTK